jgi:hypothetical protein
MLVFESVSVGVNLLIVLVIAGHAGYLPLSFNKNITRILTWLMTVLFLLNTIGNLMAVDPLEKFIFTPLTLVLTLLCYRVASGENFKNNPLNTSNFEQRCLHLRYLYLFSQSY